MMRKVFIGIAFLVFPMMLVGFPNLAQSSRLPFRQDAKKAGVTGREFTFTRLEYDSYRRGRGRGQSWMVDWPKADEQFIVGLRGWVQSLLPISDKPATVAIDDPALFTYPFIYVVEPGGMELSDEDAKHLREYLLRGGFLMLDDFWGEWAWQNVRTQLNKVVPEYQIHELTLDHPVFHCYFDITNVVQVPNFHNWVNNGQTSEGDGIIPSYEGIQDENGRLLVFIARNSDNGDAWEWIEQPSYPLRYGLAAYRLGMNLIVYSMTH
ncbi:MAG: DUF4159 domain-containing protein [Acidobacteriota bacterium]